MPCIGKTPATHKQKQEREKCPVRGTKLSSQSGSKGVWKSCLVEALYDRHLRLWQAKKLASRAEIMQPAPVNTEAGNYCVDRLGCGLHSDPPRWRRPATMRAG